MPDFKGNKPIIIQPYDKDNGYVFHVTTATSESANDGKLPFGTTISSVTAVARTEDDVIDTELIASTSLFSSNITLTLTYPTTNGDGRYKITFVLVLSNASEVELDFHRVYVKNL